MSGLDFETIFTNDITDLAADAERGPQPAFYMVAGAGPSHVRYDDLETARGRANALATTHPDETFHVLACVETIAPTASQFTPLYEQGPEHYSPVPKHIGPMDVLYFTVSDAAGALAGRDIVVVGQTDLEMLLWTIHPVHLTPVSADEAHGGAERLAGPYAPAGEGEFDARVSARRKLLSVLASEG